LNALPVFASEIHFEIAENIDRAFQSRFRTFARQLRQNSAAKFSAGLVRFDHRIDEGKLLGQRNKGKDASAKSLARNMVSQLESCFTDKVSYTGTGNGGSCLSTNTGLSYGTAAGQVEVQTPSGTGYTVVAHSTSGTNFTISNTAGVIARSCNAPGTGGCLTGSTW